MKKIAVPVTKNNEIEDHFGQCEFYEIYTFSDCNEILDLKLLESEGVCGCKSNIVNELVNNGVKFMLSGNIGDNAITKLNNAGIGVIRGCSGKSSDVILKFIEGEISDSGVSCFTHSQRHHRKNGKNHTCNH